MEQTKQQEVPLTGTVLFLVLFALSLATFMVVLDYSIANISIPYIAGDLAVSTDQGIYVITLFAIGNAIALPLTGWLTKRLGSVKLICVSLLLFTLLSFLCGMARNFEMLVLFRFFQGAAAGPLIPLSQSMVIFLSPPEKRTNALVIWATVVIVAPIAGPILGGWISYDYTWPWIFYINVPIGLLSTFMIWHFLKDRPAKIEKGAVDWMGFIFLAFAVTCLQIFLDRGEQWDWFRSDVMKTLIVTSVIAFTLLIIRENNHPDPLINLKLLKIPSFSLSLLFIFVAYAIYFGSVVLVPLWLQTNMNYTAIWAGMAVAPIGLAPVFFSSFIGKLINRYGTIPCLLICFIFFGISCFYTAFLDTDVDIFTIGISRFLLGCALTFFITPLISFSMQDLPLELHTMGAGIFHFIRTMSGAIGTSLFTTLWIRRTAYHHATIGENLTSYSQNTRGFLSHLESLQLGGNTGLAILDNTLITQAAMLSINDCFYLMGWIFVVLILFLPLGRTKRKPQTSSPVIAPE